MSNTYPVNNSPVIKLPPQKKIYSSTATYQKQIDPFPKYKQNKQNLPIIKKKY
jgi:hypothetical protein